MTMHRMLASASALLFVTVVGCGGQSTESAAPGAAASEPAATQATAPATNDAVPASTAGSTEDSARPRLVAPMRGEAELAYTRPQYKRDGNMTITTMRVQNLASAPIAGLKIDEFWYDSAGNPVTGAQSFRLARPLPPGEVVDVELRVQVVPNMQRSQVQFEHANGKIKPTLVPKL